ncbi:MULTISPECIES: hypothetical protein [Clostridium]|uniref:hypothetical protein n=1 Tax=Clostridium TaxID=1485 RepID=UPI000825DD1F|nr:MULTISPECIES: hypothetical protein [Clostridium]PJI10567.1 hypothetical protein CUB90_00825 [Clostridium sp. CT7]
MGMQWDSYNCAQDVSINAETGFRGVGALGAMEEELESAEETPTLSSKVDRIGPKSILPEIEVNEETGKLLKIEYTMIRVNVSSKEALALF